MVKALSEAEIIEALEALNGWSKDGEALSKEFKLENYLDGVALASAIGVIAQGMDHHPEMVIAYKKVTVHFSTHDAGNKITAKDVKAAQAVDALSFPKAT